MLILPLRTKSLPKQIQSEALRFVTDPETDYFSDGLTEELTTRLSLVSEIELVSRWAGVLAAAFVAECFEHVVASERFLSVGKVRGCSSLSRVPNTALIFLAT